MAGLNLVLSGPLRLGNHFGAFVMWQFWGYFGFGAFGAIVIWRFRSRSDLALSGPLSFGAFGAIVIWRFRGRSDLALSGPLSFGAFRAVLIWRFRVKSELVLFCRNLDLDVLVNIASFLGQFRAQKSIIQFK